MVSSEKADSGKFSGGRSNFSQTCSLLSQYWKEKGSFGDLSLSLSPDFAEPKGTMNLLPKIEQSDQNLNNQVQENMLAAAGEKSLNISHSGTKSGKETGQMTIFYAGQVIVFKDFPADKAEEIMSLASKCCAAHSAAQKPAESANNTPNIIPALRLPECGGHPPLPPLGSDLPIARKNSLARFLEKRKDRITANAPYQASKAASKPIKTEAWLELGSHELPLQIERHYH